jgi:oligopeptide/dipeptide ABC transporter ATP-binding protein
MYLGEVVESGPTELILSQPLHPYTQALLSAVPGGRPGEVRKRIILEGDPPSPLEPSSAERFIRRFPRHAAAFAPGPITLTAAAPGHLVRCARLEVLQELAAQGAQAWA